MAELVRPSGKTLTIIMEYQNIRVFRLPVSPTTDQLHGL